MLVRLALGFQAGVRQGEMAKMVDMVADTVEEMVGAMARAVEEMDWGRSCSASQGYGSTDSSHC